MSGNGSHFYAPRAINPARQHDMHSYMSSSPLSRSTVDLSDVTHEYSPDADADGYRHPGNHHAEHHGEWTPSLLQDAASGSTSSSRPHSKHGHHGGHHHPLIQPHGPSSLGAGVPHARPVSIRSRQSFHSERPESGTFEFEPDADADGYRHHHEAPASPVAIRALPEAIVPLDPRAGRVILTPSSAFKPMLHSPYKNLDKIPTKSIEDFQDPEELHSHAQMLYGVDEQRAPKVGVPQWMDGEALDFIQGVSKGQQAQREVSNRHVDTKLPIEPTGKMMAPVGNISGDHKPVPPSRPMKDEERPGIAGAFTKDGEGSAGLPFDAGLNSGSGNADNSSADQRRNSVGEDLTASVETVRNVPRATLADHLKQPDEQRGVQASDQPRDLEREQAQAGTAAETGVAQDRDDDARPDWLRAAELMGNNDYQRLQLAGLVSKIPTTEDEDEEYRRAARAALVADGRLKLVRGTSYPSMQEMEQAAQWKPSDNAGDDDDDDVPPRSAYPVDGKRADPFASSATLPASERNLHMQNPPVNTAARELKFASETEVPSFKVTEQGAEAVAARVGVNKEAIVGASLPATALMSGARDAKVEMDGKSEPVTVVDEPVNSQEAPQAPQVPRRPTAEADKFEKPVVPRRPASKTPSEQSAARTDAPSVPRRPAGSASQTQPQAASDTPAVPRRPQQAPQSKVEDVAAPAPAAAAAASTTRSAPIAAPKPSIPARPAVGKLAGNSKFAFASALEAKLKSGPTVPGKKREESTESAGDDATTQADAEEDATAREPLADARKGRARGPAKRKPAAAAAPVAEESSAAAAEKSAEPVASCDIGKGMTSRFGVSMRSVGIQTGTTSITVPIAKSADAPTTSGEKEKASDKETVTIVHGGSVKHPDQDVVVGTDGQVKNAATLKPATEVAKPDQASAASVANAEHTSTATTSAARPQSLTQTKTQGEKKDQLAVPTVSREEAAGGEARVLDKNLGKPTNTGAAQPATATATDTATAAGESSGEAPVPATTWTSATSAIEDKDGWERVEAELVPRDELEVQP